AFRSKLIGKRALKLAKHHSDARPDGALHCVHMSARGDWKGMRVQQLLHTIDAISTWVGKAAAWLIIGLMLLVCVEVFKRYILNAPTAWIFDADSMLYGTLFMLAGAYALAQNAHVRGDFLYSSMRPRLQAGLDLALYFVFFLPGIAALIYA